MTDASCYLSVAEDFVSHAAKLSCADAVPCIELAVSALHLYLANVLPLQDELKARLLLAKSLHKYTTNTRQVEDVILKGLIKIQNQDHLIEYKLALNEILCRVLRDLGSVNAAKQLIKDSITLCTDRGYVLDKWHFIFLFTNFELEKSLSAVRSLRALATKRANTSILKVADLLDSVVYIAQGATIPDAISPVLPADLQTYDTTQLTILDYMHLAVSILGDVLVGNIAKSDQIEQGSKRALNKLAIIHKGLDANPNMDPTIRLTIPSGPNADDKVEILTLTTSSTRRFTIFMYVLSGLVHLPEITSSKSEKFLMEGKRQLTQEIQKVGKDSWTTGMSQIVHVYTALNHLLHSRLAMVSEELSSIPTDSPILAFLRGCLAQQTGDLDGALAHFALVPEGDLSVLATLNTILIYSGPLKRDESKAKDLLLMLEAKCPAGPLRTSLELTRCVLYAHTSVALKRALTGILNASKLFANTQFNILALSILSAKSDDPHEMKLKFSSYATNQANKSANGADAVNIWANLNGQIVEHVLLEQHARRGRQVESGDDRLEKLQQLNRQNKEKMKSSMPVVYKAIFEQE